MTQAPGTHPGLAATDHADRVRGAVPRAAAWLAAVVGAIVLAGWAFDLPTLHTLIPGSVSMKANTAIAFGLVAVALGRSGSRVGAWAAAGVLVIGAVTLSEYTIGWNLQIDELIFHDPETALLGPGRMAFTTALSFVALGLALILIVGQDTRRRRIGEIIAASVALFALFELERYVLGPSPSGGYTRMALPTVILLIALSIGTVTTVRDSWLVSRATDPGVGGMLTRRLLPFALVISLALGKVAQVLGWDNPQGIALVVILGTTLLIAATLWCVSTLERLERKRRTAEAALRDVEDRFRSFFEESPIGHSITAPDGRLQVNRAFGTILGYSAEELQAASWMDLTHPDDVAGSQAMLRALLGGKANHTEMEKRYRAKDGRWVWTRVSIGAHRDGEGKVLYFLTHAQDISASKAAAEILRERERQLAEAQALAHVGSWEWDIPDNRVSWTDELYRIYGLPPDSPAGYQEFLGVVHPDDRARVQHLIEQQFADRIPIEYEWRARRADGEIRQLFNRQVVVTGAGGEPLRMVGTSLDVTERKAQEEALRSAMTEIKTLRGMLRLCANCKRVSTEDGGWESLDSYVRDHTHAEFSHGLCPDCAKTWAMS